MSISRDKKAGCFLFEFDRYINGQRIRTRKRLPKAWSQAQADKFDREESARLYAIATGLEKPQYTIDDAVAVYIKERCPHLKSGDNIIRELAQMYWAFHGKPITKVSEACKEYRDKTDLKPATVKNRIRYLTSACRYGWKHHGMAEHDPAAAVVVPTVKNERQVYIDRKTMLKIALECKERHSRAFIRIAFYSGMRTSEIFRAKVENGNFVLRDTKNGEPRLIPIHPKIRTALGKYPKSRFILGYHFRQARDKAGMPWLHFHDLRHSAASAMINSGVDLYTVGAVLGHKSAASTKRYSHLATESLAEAIGRIGK